MKYIYTIILFFSVSSHAQINTLHLSGAYQMLSQTFKGSAIDTSFTEHKQLKIFTDHNMMYVRINPADSVSAFGIGTFSISNNQLTEHVVYSATDTMENTNSFSGTVNITQNQNGYEQVIPEIMSDKGKIKLTEEYVNVSKDITSPLDGAWKLIKAYLIKDKDTIDQTNKKFKTYYAGNFAAGSFYTDTKGKKHTSVEYGIYTMKTPNQLTEHITNATLSVIKNRTFDLVILMKDENTYAATASFGNGMSRTEVYERIKNE